MQDQFIIHIHHPAICNHLVNGEALLPGLAYIDMLYQVFSEHGYAVPLLELANLTIHHPLVVTATAPVSLYITCTADRLQQHWEIQVSGEILQEGVATGERRIYATADMNLLTAVSFEEVLSPDVVQQAAHKIIDLEEIYTQCASRGLVHTGFMKTNGAIYINNDAHYIFVHAADGGDPDLLFHPALIDSSVIASSELVKSLVEDRQQLYLPLYYESFRASAAWGGQVIARILPAAVQSSNELLYVTIDFFDPAGRKVGELKNFVSKQLPVAAAVKPAAGRQPAVASSPAAVNHTGLIADIQYFLRSLIAEYLHIPLDDVEIAAGYHELGLSSSELLEIIREISKRVNTRLTPVLLFEYTTIPQLSQYLATHHAAAFQQQATAVSPAAPAPIAAPVAVAAAITPTQPRNTAGQDIAVIGIAGRYPGADNMATFWQHLTEGKNGITTIPASRWDWKAFDHKRSPGGKKISRWGGFIDDADCFDPQFFRISPREAEIMDPQERLFLEVCWETLEDAGYTPERLSTQRGPDKRQAVGVFVGVMHKDYTILAAEAVAKGLDFPLSLNYAPIANRVSYFCNFHGPSMAVDTVCSSSLTGLHLAIESILRGECEAALAGGVNLSLHPAKYLTYGMSDMHSSDGYCHTFGKDGDGYVSGEGVGAVLLKPLDKAIADKDHIYAVIKGSTINHVGTVSGLMVPSPVAQADMITACLEKTGIHPRTISYVEAHGTGTALGDPIEIQGLVKSYQKFTADKQFCAIGSVKSNIGHAESAAGISGLTKVILQLHHKKLVPSLHAAEENPLLQLSDTPFYIQRTTTDWEQPVINEAGQSKHYPRRAALSSFGATGSNAHIILEEYVPAQEERIAERQVTYLIPLSAKNEIRLRAYAVKLLAYLQAVDPAAISETGFLSSLAYTLQLGRIQLAERVVFVSDSLSALIAQLTAFIQDKGAVSGCFTGNIKKKQAGFSFLEQDEDAQVLIDSWLSKGKPDKIAGLWTAGFVIDWTMLYKHHTPGRISAPVYPFAKEKYWIPALPAATPGIEKNEVPLGTQPVVPVVEKVVKPATDNALLTFVESWEPAPVPDIPTGAKRLLCFLNETYRYEEFREALAQISPDSHVIFVAAGALFQQQDAAHFVLDVNDSSHYQQLMELVFKEGHLDGIVCKWDNGDDYTPVFHLIQALGKYSGKRHRVILTGNPADTHPLSWIGFERSLGFVLPDIQLTGLYESTWVSYADSVLQILRELPATASVLYKEEVRYIQQVKPVTLPQTTPLKAGGTYLITGGFGGLGIMLADYLATTYQANLILTGRSPLDKPKQALLDRLQSFGGRIYYIQADVCDVTAMEKGLEAMRAGGNVINGVFHIAGLEGGGSIADKQLADFNRVTAPKTAGTRILDELLATERLDFVCYYASSAAVLGDFGTCDYAVGNRFQMAYAAWRNEQVAAGQRYGKTVAINWPLWRQGGMGVHEQDQVEMYLKSSGQGLLETAEGLTLLEQILSADHSQVLVIKGQPERVQQFLGCQPKEAVTIVTVEVPAGKGRQPAMESLSLEDCLEKDLREQIAAVLKLTPQQLDPEENLVDMGYDSVSLTRLASALTKHFETTITPAVFFGYPNLLKLCHYFLEEHAAVLQAFYQEGSIQQQEQQAIVAAVAPLPPAALQEDTKVATAPATIAAPGSSQDDIAIIGMSGRFPQARNISDMWEILAGNKDVVAEIPADRFDWRQYFDDTTEDPEKIKTKWCGCVPGVKEFDPLFFEISPREAETMDPRQRLLLQESWRALEDAGYGPVQLKKGKTGMFVGVEQGDYQALALKDGGVTSTHDGILAARLSYFLDLNGPVLAINTACSSGLVALHQACLSLKNKECDTAIAAGVNLMLTPMSYVGMSRAGMLSVDGKCFVFDKRANGMVPGEAVVAVVLKRLSRALEDGDPIHAIVKGSGLNYDGKTNGITAPGGIAQADLLKETYDRYHINPADISYVVTHGTGTRLGDPVEVNALTTAFKKYTDKQSYCALTSAKTNFGHTFAASGLLSLVNMVLAMKHQTIPACLHFEQRNEFINWDKSPFYVNTKNQVWEVASGRARLGAVSAFGMSGTNAHAVLSDYRSTPLAGEGRPYYLLPLSAKTAETLKEKIREMVTFLENEPAISLQDLSFTLQHGRQHFNHRQALLVQDSAAAIAAWKKVLAGEDTPYAFEGIVSKENPEDKTQGTTIRTLLLKALEVSRQPENYLTQLTALAGFYCKGHDITWPLLYGTNLPARIHIPTYPFAKETYWVADNGSDGVLPLMTSPATSLITDFLEKGWTPLTLSPQRNQASATAILVTENSHALGTAIAAQLPGSVLVTVAASATLPVNPDGVIDLTGYQSNDPEISAWLPLLQELIEGGSKNGLRCLGVTGDAEAYRNNRVNPAGALQAALYRMLGAEYKQVHSCHLDVLTTTDTATLADVIIAVYLWNGAATEVCYREGAYYESILTPALAATKPAARVFNPEDVLLITGGTRGLGLLCANHFVSRYGIRHVVLTGREVLPAYNDWEQHIAEGGKHAAKLRNLSALSARGVVVETPATDLTDSGAVQALVADLHARGKRVGGVIHAAGLVDEDTSAFIRKSVENVARVLSPKVAGIVHLYQALQQEPLQCFILFSSVSAIIPALGAGQSDYAMANAYLDYFAAAHAGGNCPVQSIQWPSWKETGLGEVKSNVYGQTGLQTLTDKAGLALLDQILQHRYGPVVLPVLATREHWQRDTLLRKVMPVSPIVGTPVAAPVQVAAAESPALIAWLTDIFIKELKIDKSRFNIRQSFPDYGADSILLSHIRRQIEKQLGVTMDPSILLEQSTIVLLAAWMQEEYATTLAGFFNEAVVAAPLPAAVIADTAAVQPVVAADVAVTDDIVVVGMSCRFPQAPDLNGYWELLSAGRSAIAAVPFERWGSTRKYYAGLVDNITHFDTDYFIIPPEDAAAMDPQALVLLEESLHAWHHAGYTSQEVKGKQVGVYIGGRSQHRPEEEALKKMKNPIMALGQNYFAANISRFFDLHGPSLVVDTACSSALVGMELGIQAIRRGEIEAAMIGGVGLLVNDKAHDMFDQRNLLSKAAQFHIFDKRAEGIVLGEGAGFVILKSRRQALQDGDKIYAVIKGLAINNDGRTAGPATPNIVAQKEVMRTALQRSGISPHEVSYIETNGSGSEVTDLLELKGMEAIYRKATDMPCALGSVKPNIGHPLCAEGIAGFIKVVLMLMHQQQVPFISGDEPMQHYNMATSPFYFNKQLKEWDGKIAALNCFADGGTNAHVILAAPEKTMAAPRAPIPALALKKKNVRNGQLPTLPPDAVNTTAVFAEKMIWETYN
ncbi:SDR family NAD(P)-dependent oxidoreductase [Chitinophaga nivalis]|uniref:SDR family NAD(P)-dependent oxidoreductase n=1 Tax=Chitinophaga nivalis TaxID=2991709 RepID=A0ABT3IIU1_9BACT|nr:SDR family NAD(P)-dependent oxidoreductase [Chitinophaga nivalis]MCW3466422.1 SDR family NAD(P)-dependent oxidoreductase [Chitinophaga nivalis]MCW3483887.1 SDR family NAD(P)-dependent oxidoreductase [Chitinophaga nivalis]